MMELDNHEDDDDNDEYNYGNTDDSGYKVVMVDMVGR